MTRIKPVLQALLALALCVPSNSAWSEEGHVVEAIDRVWSAHRARFDFVGRDEHQVIAYYDESRQMSVAHRRTPRSNWRYHKLPSYLGWDSHNSVVIGIDEAGFIHVTGNMHNDPLVYFRSLRPFDVRSLIQVPNMVEGVEESRVTYPHFFNGPDGRLYFKHRYGGSGNGNEFYKVFDTGKMRWRQLHESAFVDGEGERNGYFVGPQLENDGFFHLVWVWRETPSAATNHDLSYARSRDLLDWETSDGDKLELPIRLSTAEVVDAVPEGGGLLNGQTPLGLDADGRPMIAYQKYDAAGLSQVWLSRRESAGWKTVRVSDFDDYRADLDRTGALALELSTRTAPFADDAGRIIVRANLRGEDFEFTLDPDSLEVISQGQFERYPSSVLADDLDNDIALHIKPMNVNGKDSAEWFIAWEAQRPNRDKAREDISAPSTLRIHFVPQAKQ